MSLSMPTLPFRLADAQVTFTNWYSTNPHEWREYTGLQVRWLILEILALRMSLDHIQK